MKPKINPLESIGICFSGGGYRASAYSLGALSYLNKVQFKDEPLLKKVEALSTVSGGTLPGALYAYAQSQGWNFPTFYDKFNDFLCKDELLGVAVKTLEDRKIWQGNHKKRSLINAFALAYDKLLCNGSFKDINNLKTSLQDVCFNATELSYGLAFRFQNGGKFGNNPLNSQALNKIKHEVKISDAIASSSCFPFGFEPMIFPDDFFADHKKIDYKALKQKKILKDGVGLMDGGIVDNQGIGSMVNIDKRRKQNPLNTIIVCDVGSYKMDPWQQDDENDSKSKRSVIGFISKFLKLLKFKWYNWFFVLIGSLVIGFNSMGWFSEVHWPFLDVLGGVLLGAGSVLFIIGLITHIVKKLLTFFFARIYRKTIPEVLLDDVEVLQKLDISLVKRMIGERLSSSFVIVNEVFLNQIRRLNYRLFYEKERFENRRISARVYQLNGEENALGQRFEPSKKIKEPNKKINASALIASQTPTTLWWDKEDKRVNRQENLVACGQFTVCYNLLDYIINLPPNLVTPDLKTLENDLRKDWNSFLNDPLFML